jgi:hypothetical protein
MVRVDFADRQRHPVRRGDEFPQDGHELGEAEPDVAARILGDRQVQVVEDVDVDVNEEAPEALGPSLDDTTRDSDWVSRDLRQPDLGDPPFRDDPPPSASPSSTRPATARATPAARRAAGAVSWPGEYAPALLGAPTTSSRYVMAPTPRGSRSGPLVECELPD